MAVCTYCEQDYSDERAEAGYDYCLDEHCQNVGLDKSEREFRKEYTPALLHKCNYFWVHKSDLPNIGVKK